MDWNFTLLISCQYSISISCLSRSNLSILSFVNSKNSFSIFSSTTVKLFLLETWYIIYIHIFRGISIKPSDNRNTLKPVALDDEDVEVWLFLYMYLYVHVYIHVYVHIYVYIHHHYHHLQLMYRRTILC
jgi:hypothetical protein